MTDHAGEYVMQLVAFANPVSIEGALGALAASHLGRWLVSYDLEARTAQNMIVTTSDPAKAKGFPDTMAATQCWRRTKGRRADGRPNRPLTAYTVSITRRPPHG